jgi:hypothetical protein
MSESTGAPATASVPAGPAPGTGAGEGSPPANTQPAISISEAARLLGRQRRQAAPADGAAPAPAPADAGRRPSANELAARPPSTPAPAPAAPADTGLSAMERALGVPGVAAPEGAPSPTPAPAADAAPVSLGEGIEIEGQRLRTIDDVREFARRKSAHFTQQTQEVADARRQVQAQQEALATVLPLIQPELARLAETIAQPVNRPDPQLLETNPQQYLREQAHWQHAVEEQSRLANINSLQAQAQARAMEQAVAAGNEQLTREFPFWGDPAQRLVAQQQIVQWATTKGGYTRQELSGLASPHHLKAMLKASLFDKWVESAKGSAPAMIAPARGSPPPPAPTERIASAQQAFDDRPSIRAGAALLGARRAALSNGRG